MTASMTYKENILTIFECRLYEEGIDIFTLKFSFSLFLLQIKIVKETNWLNINTQKFASKRDKGRKSLSSNSFHLQIIQASTEATLTIQNHHLSQCAIQIELINPHFYVCSILFQFFYNHHNFTNMIR